MSTSSYTSPLSERYASREMLYLFSMDKKFTTWRKLWVALARAERELGLNITLEQIAELEAHVEDIDYAYAADMERRLKHDVMAHIHAYGKVCPSAMPIIHLGATSCYVGDNTDVIIMREGLILLRAKLVDVIARLSDFAAKYKSLPTLGYTHFQAAQLTTVGKRASLWLNDFLMDLTELEYRIDTLQLLGSKGTTGTQASFMELFDGDHGKIRRMEELISAEMGFGEQGFVPVSGQTYSRKVDYNVLSVLSGIAQSASKFATDLRLLAHLKELEEPFEEEQVGSSAMPYKRNPMRSERICSLARYVMADVQNPAMTASSQWFERTLDDSANRRISLPEAFLATDAILHICSNILSGIVVNERVIARNIEAELPFMATENILMDAVRRGGDRQELHEKIRVHSLAAGAVVKQEGLQSDLTERIAADPAFGRSLAEIQAMLNPSLFIGRAPEQVEDFLRDFVDPVLVKYAGDIGGAAPEMSV